MHIKFEKLALNFLKWFNSWEYGDEITITDVAKYVASDIYFYLNGQLLSQGIENYYQRIKTLHSSVKKINVQFPVVNMIVAENKVAINYVETFVLTDNSEKLLVNAMFLHFDSNRKISKLYDIFTAV